MSQVDASQSTNDLKSLKVKRAVVKGRITHVFKKIDAEVDANITVLKGLIDSYLAEIEAFDVKINEILLSECSEESEFSEHTNKEFDNQTEYIATIKTKLSLLEQDTSDNGSAAKTDMLPISDSALKLPELKCDTFSGEGVSNLQFHSFIIQFDNIIGLRTNISCATKFTYLKTYLRGYALKLIQHLQITDANYEVALQLLTNEFLNKKSLISDLLDKLLSLKPKSDGFIDVKLFINEVRCILCDLHSYDIDLFKEVAGNTLVSHIVFNKLPQLFKQELGRKLSNNYSQVQDIFDNYVEVIQTLQFKDKYATFKPKFNDSGLSNNATKFTERTISQNSGTVSSATKFHANSNRYCKYCSCNCHTMLHCKKFPNHKSRLGRCRELKVCFNRSSHSHTKSDCSKPLDFACKFCTFRLYVLSFLLI